MTRIGDRPRRAMDWKRLLLPTLWCALLITAAVLCGPARAEEAPPQGKDAEPKPILILKGHGGPIFSVAYSLDGKSLFTMGRTYSCLWDLTTGKKVRNVLQEGALPYGTVWSQNRERIAFGLNGGSKVRVIEAATSKEVRTFERSEASIGGFGSYTLSPDGLLLAARQSTPTTVHVWDIKSGNKLHEWSETNFIYSLAFSPDGRVLACGGDNASPRLRDVRTGKETRLLEDWPNPRHNAIIHLAFSPDGKLLAAADRGYHKVVSLWDTATGKKRAAFRVPVEAERRKAEQRFPVPETVAFSPDGRWLVSAWFDSVIRIWEVETGKEGPSWSVPCYVPFAVSPEGSTFITGGNSSEEGNGWPTALAIWDRTSISNAVPTQGKYLELRWEELSSADAVSAYKAVWALTAVPEEAMKRAQRCLRNRPPTARIQQAITDLGARQFSARKRALTVLAALDERARPALEAALTTKPELDVRLRIEGLLEKINDPLNPERLRNARLIEVLEHIGNRQACEILKTITDDNLGPTAARDAAVTLQRLSRGKTRQ